MEKIKIKIGTKIYELLCAKEEVEKVKNLSSEVDIHINKVKKKLGKVIDQELVFILAMIHMKDMYNDIIKNAQENNVIKQQYIEFEKQHGKTICSLDDASSFVKELCGKIKSEEIANTNSKKT